jgi:hypothetical protein
MKKRRLVIIGIIGILVASGAIVGAIQMYFPSIHLPDKPVTMKTYNGTVSYFDVYLFDVPNGLDITNGYYVAWCADRSTHMPREKDLTVRLYNSYDLLLPLPLRDKNWDKVNYIINHKGNATKVDIQDAIWYLLNDYPYDKITNAAQNLVNTAQNGFIPKPGDFIAILAEPVHTNERPWPFQFTFIEIRLPPQEGLSHGYWKNHDGWPMEYTQSMLLNDVFSNASLYVPMTDTMLDALTYKGGDDEAGAAQILLRNAVASVLNAQHPCINYPILTDDLIAEVNEALGSHNRDTMLNLEKILNDYNNLGADLSK